MTYRYRRYSRRPFIPLLFFFPLLLYLFFPAEKNIFSAAGSQNMDDSRMNHSVQEVTVSDNGIVSVLPLEEYVAGVVAAEMPSHFEEEALKSQAVIARTYALWKVDSENACHDNSAELCSDPGHCQAYYNEDVLRQMWGEDYQSKYDHIVGAVSATEGQVLMYEGDLAETYYHSTCGGKTASAEEVWGKEIPYLQSVSCKWDSDAPRYCETFILSLSELPWLLGNGTSPCIAVAKGETVSHVPTVASYTESGRIEEVVYADLLFDAIDFRSALGLNSTNFKLESDGDILTVTTFGFGHGVGLCQYGANGMAKDGYDCEEILLYYYCDTTLGKKY